MRGWPRSIFGRLLGLSALTTVAALAFAAVAIGHVLERFVTRGLDQQLDAQVMTLAQAVRADGTLAAARAADLPAFTQAGSGWGWRVDGPVRHWAQGAAFAAEDDPPARHRHEPGFGPQPGEGRAADGSRVHLRQVSVATEAGPVLVAAAGPRRVADAPLREAMVPLLGSLALLGGALALATLLQLRLGLGPLRQLQRELADVRAGRRRHISGDQPAEVAPLAAELNALIDQNDAGLAHARRHVSNLAHGLKTPLAALGVRLAESGRDPDGSLGEIVTAIDRSIRHHLGRARAAAPGSGRRPHTLLGPAIANLAAALERIHADRPIRSTVTIASALTVAVDPQDLDEMAGNLIDNAWRHARSAVTVKACDAGRMVRLTIEDDGPGLGEADMAQAVIPGRRLDERGDGHGFGLPIAQELAEMNGGGLALARSVAGGLRVTLTLPATA